MAHATAEPGERKYNTLNDAYFMPSDDKEWERLNKQHVAYTIGLGGLVPCPDLVDACLVPNAEKPTRILDLGCGSGIWANQMATQYPHASVLGVDLAATPFSTLSPVNVQFEIYDINQGLSKFHDSFDLVHARLVCTGVKDYRAMTEDASKCLKPGGVIVFVEYDAMFCNEDQIHRHPMAESADGEGGKGSWLVRCSHELRNGSPMLQSDILGMEKCLDEGLWQHKLLDPETAVAGSFFLPIGPWATGPDEETTKKLQLTGSLMGEDLKSAFLAILLVLTRFGVPQEVVNEWRPKVEAELDTTRLRMWMRSRLAWARRRAELGESAPVLPSLPSGVATNDKNMLAQEYANHVHQPVGPVVPTKQLEKVEWVHIYETQKECVDAARIRNESLGPVPVPWVLRNHQS